MSFSKSLVPETKATLAVAAWMTGALFAFCVIALSIRSLSSSLGIFEANAIRTGGGLIALTGYFLCVRRMPSVIDASNMRLHATRNLVHWGASLLWTASVTLLPLATVFALEFTTPLWVALFAMAFTKQRVSSTTFIGLVAGLAGAFIIIRPDTDTFNGLASLPLTTAAFLAIATLLTKRLTVRNGVADILFWMMALQFSANMCVVIFQGGQWGLLTALFSPEIAFAASALVIGGLASQLCLTSALRVGSAVSVVSFDFLRVPVISVIGYFAYGETIGVHTIVGSLVIMAASVTVLKVNSQPATPPKPIARRSRAKTVNPSPPKPLIQVSSEYIKTGSGKSGL